jgi:cell division septation protein DedD
VEFAGGAWADRALERLAWIAEVSGDRLGAARRYEAITRDYPLSELAARARTWLKEHAPEVAELQAAEAAAASSAAGTVGGAVGGIRAGVGAETGNGAGTGDKRAAARSAAAPPSAGRPASTGAASAGRGGEAGPARPPAAVRSAADPAPERRPAPVSGARPDPTPAAPAPATAAPAAAPAAAIGSFTVQLGAFLNPARAMAVADRASRADHEARRVRMPDDSLVRVRVGRFVRRAEAEALVAALRAAGFEARVADDATRELPYR